MNHRVLELLKAPKNIQSEDLDLLKEEINSFPYIQNIRALYLYGVHLHDKENYQKVLSTTAAYTTDKKILYQLINGKIQQKPISKILSETIKEKTIPAENPLKLLQKAKLTNFPIKRVEEPAGEARPERIEELKTNEIQLKEEAKHVYVDGERNRILFEGEESFLNDNDVETIDLESTLESGSIVTQKIEKKQEPENVEQTSQFTLETIIEEKNINSESEKETVNEIRKEEKNTEFTSEKIINEDEISSEEGEKSVRDDEELSFHRMESFMPDVKIQANNSENVKAEIPQSGFNKNEEEMRRLIEEVEKKMKEKAASQKIKKREEPENTGHDISFAETQSFEVKPAEPEIRKEEKKEKLQNVLPESKDLQDKNNEAEPSITQKTEVKSSWKPMSFETNLPDSLINKPVENPQRKIETEAPKIETPQPETPKAEIVKEKEILPAVEAIPELKEDKSEEIEDNKESLQVHKEVPKTEAEKNDVAVMNVSFFGSGWTLSQPEKEAKEEERLEEKTGKPASEAPRSNTIDSNVPGFINTWQSWLKIERTAEVEKEKAEIKVKAIEAFIENNPKISQLKDEVNFVVKEKNDDISHLMTETLANLYFEQKLYIKAIKAFEALIKKTPEKKEYYEGKIQEIKDYRSKG
ncbi:hypothetical protein SAMN05880574_10210 [Chryseobacterium sp. RU37D]|uniref:hypothetical protein n=1 Tax=Chryseobacterium sp. RU37D TaxID=1907397 RepID=UPI0009557DB8|nr:hypothetical protein [Chryseobacterium sp. RU37D]SIP89900.1 hypothetical protein SAMN05880574_10210 [Chryseobacterium sp. RU37D]